MCIRDSPNSDVSRTQTQSWLLRCVRTTTSRPRSRMTIQALGRTSVEPTMILLDAGPSPHTVFSRVQGSCISKALAPREVAYCRSSDVAALPFPRLCCRITSWRGLAIVHSAKFQADCPFVCGAVFTSGIVRGRELSAGARGTHGGS